MERHERTEKGTNERNQSTKDRYRTGDNVRHERVAGSAANPSNPMSWRVAYEMCGTTEDSHEEILGCELERDISNGYTPDGANQLTCTKRVVLTIKPGKASP